MANKKVIIAIVIFVFVLLCATFFSRTLSNFFLPDVSAYLPAPGEITHTVETDGKVEPADAEIIYSDRDAVVENVYVSTGDAVKEGQELISFKVDNDKTAETEKNIDSTKITIEQYNNEITQDQEKIATLKKEKQEENDSTNKEIKENEDKLDDLKNENIDDDASSDADIQSAEKDLEHANENYDSQKVLYDSGIISKSALDDAQSQVDSAQAALDKANAEKNDVIKDKSDSNSSKIDDTNGTISGLRKQLSSDNENFDGQITDLQNDITTLQTQIELANLDMDYYQESLEDEEDNVIKAPEDGIVADVSTSKSMFVSANDPLITMCSGSCKFYVKCYISEEQAQTVVANDECDIEVSSLKINTKGSVLSLNENKEANATNDTAMIITVQFSTPEFDFDVLGKQANVSILAGSQNYDLVVPNSAVRQDSMGYYVFVLRKSESSLGEGYSVQRVAVNVLDSDDKNSAVDGMKYIEPVVTNSSIPLIDGQVVKYEGDISVQSS